MIQRIQTIWLFLAIVCLALSLYFPFFSSISNSLQTSLTASSSTSTLIIAVVNGFVLLTAIFLFKNRGFQKALSMISILLSVTLIVLLYLKTKQLLNGNFELTTLLSILPIIFTILAIYAISKDEKLLKSTDRFR